MAGQLLAYLAMSINLTRSILSATTQSIHPSIRVEKVSPHGGLGIVATSPIKAGELLIKEQPLFTLPTRLNSWRPITEREAIIQIQSSIDKLDPANAQLFHCLHGWERPHCVLSKFTTNAYPLDGPDSGDPDRVQTASGIFPLISRINSACIPNVHYHFDNVDGAATIHAIRPIRQDEELLNCYVNTLLSRSMRRQYLKSHFGFDCMCNACNSATFYSDDLDRTYLVNLIDEGRAAAKRRDMVALEKNAFSRLKLMNISKSNFHDGELTAASATAGIDLRHPVYYSLAYADLYYATREKSYWSAALNYAFLCKGRGDSDSKQADLKGAASPIGRPLNGNLVHDCPPAHGSGAGERWLRRYLNILGVQVDMSGD